MKLTEIQIDRCGPWRNLTLPVPAQGTSVYVGPNESGKTTLRKFIRGVLFGFDGQADESTSHAAGSLQIETGAGHCRSKLAPARSGSIAPPGETWLTARG
jgi:hypothetical protein